MIEVSARTTVYGLSRPTLAEARAAIERTQGHRAGEVWAELLRRADACGIADAVDVAAVDVAAVDAVVAAAVVSSDGITALCGRALAIRIATFDHLVTAERVMAPFGGGGRGPGR